MDDAGWGWPAFFWGRNFLRMFCCVVVHFFWPRNSLIISPDLFFEMAQVKEVGRSGLKDNQDLSDELQWIRKGPQGSQFEADPYTPYEAEESFGQKAYRKTAANPLVPIGKRHSTELKHTISRGKRNKLAWVVLAIPTITLIDWLIWCIFQDFRSIARSVDWLIDWFGESTTLVHWLIDWLIDWSVLQYTIFFSFFQALWRRPVLWDMVCGQCGRETSKCPSTWCVHGS